MFSFIKTTELFELTPYADVGKIKPKTIKNKTKITFKLAYYATAITFTSKLHSF